SQTAIAMGLHLGKQLVERAKGRSVPPFQFKPAGYIISLGKNSSVLELFGIPLSGRLAWLLWAAAYLIKMVGLRKQIEVGIDHLTHLLAEHDSSQILNRRQILSDEELNLSLGTGPHRRGEAVGSTAGKPRRGVWSRSTCAPVLPRLPPPGQTSLTGP